MNTDRRTFFGAALAAAVLPPCVTGTEIGEAASAEKCDLTRMAKKQRVEFPVLILELCGKYSGEEDPQIATHQTSRRLVVVDLEDEEDWGDLNTFWDGTSVSWGLGNDVDGYWKIDRVFEIQEPTIELHEGKFPMSYEITFDELSAIVAERIESWT